MYSLNEAVVYASYGVCVIEAIETHDFSGENIEYYVLRPVGDMRNKFYVPTSNSSLTEKMRKVYSKDEVEKLIDVMPDEDFIWIDNEIQRKEEYRHIIESGDRHQLVKLIKTLYIRRSELSKQHKKLRSADERFLSEAENILYDEFAYALEIPRDEVVGYIKKRIA
ncbi:MAG TPA: transcriptional regulator [Ruminococcus sp.]|nr:transcriptional regulator [Ruminococcus sp.]